VRNNAEIVGETRQQPIMPLLAARPMIIRPAQSGAHCADAKPLEPGNDRFDTIMLPGPKPFDHAEERLSLGSPRDPEYGSVSVHTARPRQASSRFASSKRSVASCLRSHPVNSDKPSSRPISGSKPRPLRAADRSAKQ